MGKILLFDGNSIINRAFYAMPVLTNRDGIHTNAVYGFMNMFYRFVDEEKPDYVGVAFDLPAPTMRHEKFAEYKGTRKSMPDDLRPQIPLLKELLASLNVKTYELAGYEADDILGTLAKNAADSGNSTVIISGDRDMLQMAGEKIKIRIPKTKAGKTEVLDYGEAEVMSQYGVTPTQFIDVKALMGDSSDNIPGVTGIGEKTAVKIISEYKTLENAIENAEKLKPKKAGETLIKEQDIARLSKELATIVTDAPVDLGDAKFDGKITEEGLSFFERLGFKALIGRRAGVGPDGAKTQNAADSAKDFSLVGDVKAFTEKLCGAETVSYQIFEHNGEINGFAFSLCDSDGYFIEIESPLHEETVLRALRPFFENEGIRKIALDAKHSYKALDARGVSVKNVVFDVLVAGYVLDPTSSGYSFDSLAYKYLGSEMQSEEDVLGKGKSKLSVCRLADDIKTGYCCGVANAIFRLYEVMDKKLSESNQTDLYYEIEDKLIGVLFCMEKAGIKVDRAGLEKYGDMLAERLEVLTSVIYELAGKTFNINSPKQLGEILFEDMGLKSLKKTKTGYSTGIEELERLKFEHPIINKIIEYRTYSKLKSTYADGLLAVMDTKTDKLHTTFNQAVAATGRLSSTDPNLQNIPIRLELGRELRKVFIPDSSEYTFIDGDYSQIELRVLAHLSGDETLINAFKSGMDIHRLTASQVNNMPYELITPGQRSAAKAVNFGIIYGISAFSLSVDLGISKKEAEKYIAAYFAAYPKIKQYLDNCIAEAKMTGLAKTMFNRTRPMPELSSSNFNMRSFGERVAMNMPIQGAAADIIKIAMIMVHNKLKELGLKSRMLLQVHDELLILAHKSEAEEVAALLKEQMENAADLLAPLEADIHMGDTWFDAK